MYVLLYVRTDVCVLSTVDADLLLEWIAHLRYWMSYITDRIKDRQFKVKQETYTKHASIISMLL
jgi:hypothetical protein